MAQSCETGTATVEEKVGKLDEKVLHNERAPSTTRNYLAVVTCVYTPVQFWARIGEGEEKNTARDK